jgi:hypothetical protein
MVTVARRAHDRPMTTPPDDAKHDDVVGGARGWCGHGDVRVSGLEGSAESLLLTSS